MKTMRRKLFRLAVMLLIVVAIMKLLTGCGKNVDTQNTINVGNTLSENQPTPTDIDYSLERYNLIRRSYWVNGQREKANSLVCPISKPLGYIVLFTDSGAVVEKFVVDGKVSSLNSYLTPDSLYYEYDGFNYWVPDIDGSYGENDDGIFFFTPDGKYVEWTGTYLYTDIPCEVDNPVLRMEGKNEQ